VSALVELRGVRAAYGRIEVLHGVDLTLNAGEVLALLGRNGAGKSTTLAVISGQLAMTSGSFVLAGRQVRGATADELARVGVCTIPEGQGVFPNLTVADNLVMATYAGVSRREVETRAYERFPRLGERRKQLAGTLSGGEQQMLTLARALATNPAILLLDELSMGLAPIVVEQLYEQVATIAAGGVSVLIVEQFARAVLAAADRAALMAGGQVVRVGTPAEIESELTGAYLGEAS
jgi:branched-chain amino acid transport system ATP-binding protein